MKILVTGSKGFVAKNLIEHFKDSKIVELNRSVLDLRDRMQFDNFMSNNTFDILFHTAMVGGRRDETTDSNTLYDNVTMFYNILRHRKKFGKIINFGSGAELDRYTVTQDAEQFPIDPYGMSKNIINRISSQFKEICNLRIYNVFGDYEPENRMIRFNILNYINKQPINIHQDKLMDFFYINDLVTVIKHCLVTDSNNIDCVYKEKHTLSDIAQLINNLDTHRVHINVLQEDIAPPYVGDSKALDSLNLNLTGLHQGVREIYNKLVVNR
jgi:GDP-L-fucose synthase